MKNNDFWLPDNITDENINEARKLINEAKHIMACYRCAIMEIETKFNVLNTEFSLKQSYNPIETIKTRLKSPESIAGKIKRKNLPLNIDVIEREINDIAGVRVICPFISDIYMLADCLLEQDDVTLLERKDYIKAPKDNGYRSLHLIVEIPIFLQKEKRRMKVEIQLRTIAMDFWASLDHRLWYKKELDEDISQKIAEELRQCADDSANLDIRMENVKNAIGVRK